MPSLASHAVPSLMGQHASQLYGTFWTWDGNSTLTWNSDKLTNMFQMVPNRFHDFKWCIYPAFKSGKSRKKSQVVEILVRSLTNLDVTNISKKTTQNGSPGAIFFHFHIAAKKSNTRDVIGISAQFWCNLRNFLIYWYVYPRVILTPYWMIFPCEIWGSC